MVRRVQRSQHRFPAETAPSPSLHAEASVNSFGPQDASQLNGLDQRSARMLGGIFTTFSI